MARNGRRKLLWAALVAAFAPFGLTGCAPFSMGIFTPIPVPDWFLKWVAFSLPMKWPQGTPTRPEVDPRKDGTPTGEFSADCRELLQLLDRFTGQPRDFAWQPHPIFGPMTDAEWMRWGYLHMDHHLRQFGA